MKTITTTRILLAAAFSLVLSACQKKPSADFQTTSLNSNGDNELTIYSNISFDNLTVNGHSYEWDFGDGNTSSIENPQHQYSSPGKYTVQLTAFSKNGKKSEKATKDIEVNRWSVTDLHFTFGVTPTFWGDSTGCFETTCDTLSARIYFYAGNDTTPVYTSPIMRLGNNSTNQATLQLPSAMHYTNEDWRITFVHVYATGAAKKFAEHTFNPVLTATNGFVNNKHEHLISVNKGGVGVGLTLYFDKKPQ